MNENDRYRHAKRRVRSLRGFYRHLAVYVIVNAFLFTVNRVASPDYDWFTWPLLGWGVALLIHALSVFVMGGVLGSEWEERKIREIMEKEDKKKGQS